MADPTQPPFNPYATVAPPEYVPTYQSGNPFAPPSDPNAMGPLGISYGTAHSLMQLGANISNAAGQRTGQGFLANPGFLGPVLAGLGQTMQQGQQDVNARTAYNYSSAQTLGQQLTNREKALENMYQQWFLPWKMQQIQSGGLTDNGTGLPGGPQVAPQAGASVNGGPGGSTGNVPPAVAAAFRTLEGGSPDASGGKLNQLGYAGTYQMGTAALESAGLYKPGKDEDLTKNQWAGQITIPGFDPMNVQQFLGNQKAQDVAFGIHMNHLGQEAHNLGLDQYLGQTVGGVKITPETLAAMEHYTGPQGTLRFLQSGGVRNPTDANKKYTVAAYANTIASKLPAGYQSPADWFVKSPAGTNVAGGGAPAPAAAPATGAGAAPTAAPVGGANASAPGTTTDTTGSPGANTASASAPYAVAQAGDGVQPAPASGGSAPGAQAPQAGQVGADTNAILQGMSRNGAPAVAPPAAPVTTAAAGAPAAGAPIQLAQGGNGPYAVHPGQTLPPATPPGYVSPQQAMQRALYLRQLQQKQAIAGMGDLAAATGQQAQQLESYAQTELQQQTQAAQQQTLQQTAPQEGRGPGSYTVYGIGPDGKPIVVQSPIEREILGPDRRHYMITLNSVDTGKPYQRPAGIPDWAPPGTLTMSLKDLSDTEKSAMKEAAETAFGPEATKEYRGAANSIRTLEDVDYEFNRLNATPGAFNTGPGLNFKVDMARAMNTVSRTLGGGDVVDPDHVASVEDLIKNSKLLGMDVLTSRFGGNREAASIVQSSQMMVPNIENSPLGGKLLVNAYKEAARFVMDQHAWNTNWYFTHNGNMVGSDIAFMQSHPPEAYTDRAVSQAFPMEVEGKDPSEIARFLPGTKVFTRGVVDPATGQPKIKTLPGDVGIKLSIPQTSVPGGISVQPPGVTGQ